ncbi:A24 family peptidase [Brevibacillus ruminantium]|uniref:A24 family peptidase n=1 Tax=Brevibacillus ruminantium TaxID=2950604 RepID=A0ABY4WF85_9BACL|nr:A24 family peptidase [Brevibacillus ruminantium]USG65688.1 A24 family peptidase [Brevibacillus ruminantium]
MEWVLIVIPMCLIMVIATITDIRRRMIYNWLTLPGIAYFLIVHAILHPGQWFTYMLGMLLLGGISLLMAIVSRGQLGGGDIKLLALVGAAVGWQAGIYALVFTYILACLVAIPIWIASKFSRKTGGSQALPMAPFIAGGTTALLLLSLG